MSFTTIGRNKVYASIEDLPENLKLVNGDRLLIQTDNGTALVDWENVKVPADHTEFGDTIDDIKSYIDEVKNYFDDYRLRLENLDDAVRDISNELCIDYTKYNIPEEGEGISAQEAEKWNPEPPEGIRINNIMTRLSILEGNELESTHKPDGENPYEHNEEDYIKIEDKSTPRIDKIENRLKALDGLEVDSETTETTETPIKERIKLLEDDVSNLKTSEGIKHSRVKTIIVEGGTDTITETKTLNLYLDDYFKKVDDIEIKLSALESTVVNISDILS
ncbi:MAG: hypothetical protein J6R59_00600 [Paludibacteraceae bacterium]|nr:hypothetical protein [Paludibacteraceae bacterium]